MSTPPATSTGEGRTSAYQDRLHRLRSAFGRFLRLGIAPAVLTPFFLVLALIHSSFIP
jgi:hypothetical protein